MMRLLLLLALTGCATPLHVVHGPDNAGMYQQVCKGKWGHTECMHEAAALCEKRGGYKLIALGDPMLAWAWWGSPRRFMYFVCNEGDRPKLGLGEDFRKAD